MIGGVVWINACPGNPTNVAGAPVGGNVGPSMSAAKKDPHYQPRAPVGLMKVAGKPAKHFRAIKANAWGPR